MRNRTRTRLTRTAVLTLALTVAMSGTALATGAPKAPDEKDAKPEVAQVVSTLPVLGSGLTITINRTADGAIDSVALDGVAAGGAETVKERDHKVVFQLSDGETTVSVKSRAGKVETKVRSSSTDAISGPGTWSGDVFGTGLVTINYTVGFDGIIPTITIGGITTPDGVTAEVGEAKLHESKEGNKARTKVKVLLTNDDGDRAAVILSAGAHLKKDGEVKAGLSVTFTDRSHRGKWGHDRDRGDRDDKHDRGGDRDGRGDRDKGDRGGRGSRGGD